MPRNTAWFHRLTEILGQLHGSSADILDRSDIEALFSASPRQATRILHRMGAGRCGGALVISRQELVSGLELLQKDKNVIFQQQRNQRLHAKLEEARLDARSRRIAIPMEAISDLEIDKLPEEIKLRRGELSIRFSNSTELLQRLMLLAQVIAEDLAGFENAVRR